MVFLESDPKWQSEANVTRFSCPDCPGVLAVRTINGRAHFRCRIGHTYSLVDLVKAKEERLEEHMWAPVTALEELADLLESTTALPERIAPAEIVEERVARARRLAAELRRVIDENPPIALHDPAESHVDGSGEK